jgi:hypothetical protein
MGLGEKPLRYTRIRLGFLIVMSIMELVIEIFYLVYYLR